MKKKNFAVYVIIGIILLLNCISANSFAEENIGMISCAEHGELTEDEVSTWIILNGEYKFCSLCLMDFWKNNHKEVRRLIKNMQGYEK